MALAERPADVLPENPLHDPGLGRLDPAQASFRHAVAIRRPGTTA